MQYKTYRASTVKDAMAQIKKELGPDAIILSTKKVENDDQRNLLLGKRFEIEVTVAIESEEPITGAQSFEEQKNTLLGYTNRGKAFFSKPQQEPAKELIDYKPDSRLQKYGRVAPSAAKPADFSHLKEQMDTFLKHIEHTFDKKLSDSRMSVEKLMPHIEELQQELHDIRKELAERKKRETGKQETELSALGKALIEQEVDKEIVQSICKNLDPAMHKEDPLTSQPLMQYLTGLISRITRYSDGLEVEEGQQKRLAIIGPTGVGKTTTVAKLAADIALIAGRKLAVFSIDTFRIGAQEQLATYADIINVPFEVIHDAQELNEKLELHADKDFILIDTVGRGSYNHSQIEAMRGLLAQASEPVEIHLAISAVTKWSDLRDIVDTFGICDISCLLFTKLDETRRFGTIFNLAVRTQIPVSYMTDGQNVPEDIAIMNAQAMTGLLLKRIDPSMKAETQQTLTA